MICGASLTLERQALIPAWSTDPNYPLGKYVIEVDAAIDSQQAAKLSQEMAAFEAAATALSAFRTVWQRHEDRVFCSARVGDRRRLAAATLEPRAARCYLRRPPLRAPVGLSLRYRKSTLTRQPVAKPIRA